jgi:hypothetical protein
MYRLNHTAPARRTLGHGHKMLAVRTYRRIAEILAERGGAPVSPARVKQICHAAEMRFTRAFLADPVIQKWLGLEAVRVR